MNRILSTFLAHLDKTEQPGFAQAPELGSLLNPGEHGGKYKSAFHEVAPLLDKALQAEKLRTDFDALSVGVAAKGIAKAAEVLSRRFTLVATNVPYLGRTKQGYVLKTYAEQQHPTSKADIATCFVERSLMSCVPGGTVALVTPQSWLFLRTYKKFREKLLKAAMWKLVARLGPKAFETIGGEVANVVLLILSTGEPSEVATICGIDVADARTPADKEAQLAALRFLWWLRSNQIN